MSVERSFEAWEEMQRHGHELADRLAHGFSGLLHPPPFSWPHSSSSPSAHKKPPFDLHLSPVTADGVSAILDIGSQLGRAGAEFGACLNGVVEQFFRQIPVPFGGTSAAALRADLESRSDDVAERPEELRLAAERLGDSSALEAEVAATGLDEFADEDAIGLDLRDIGQFGRPQGIVNITSTYDSRTHDIESSFVARGGLWRAEASHGGSTSGNDNPPHFLVQLGPVLFVRDSTLLLPVHLSKHHLLWYGYDRKNGLHSLCPALWSKHRRWLLMSMICLNPLACSFMDLQFPNGQLTYVAGEGLTTSAFFPVLGGLLQAHGQLPGEMRFSFSYKNKQGTLVTPLVQWPDKSFSLGVVQALAWRRYGLMERPSIEFSICPTFGGSNPGLHAEFIHSLKEKLSLIFGCDCAIHPFAFASLSLGRSKWNGHVGKSGIVIRVEAPLSNIGRPSFSVQLNTGVEF